MDDIVRAALRKWPDVPHCYGWLALDARGQWFMRDDRTRAAGPFPHVKGSRIEHDKLLAFIGRNYDHDASGCWFFQNGPQRVYVTLEATPWVWRLQESPGVGSPHATRWPQVHSHTGIPARVEPQAILTDEDDRAYLVTDLGLGIVHSLDVALLAPLVETGACPVQTARSDELPQRFCYRREPTPG